VLIIKDTITFVVINDLRCMIPIYHIPVLKTLKLSVDLTDSQIRVTLMFASLPTESIVLMVVFDPEHDVLTIPGNRFRSNQI